MALLFSEKINNDECSAFNYNVFLKRIFKRNSYRIKPVTRMFYKVTGGRRESIVDEIM